VLARTEGECFDKDRELEAVNGEREGEREREGCVCVKETCCDKVRELEAVNGVCV